MVWAVWVCVCAWGLRMGSREHRAARAPRLTTRILEAEARALERCTQRGVLFLEGKPDTWHQGREVRRAGLWHQWWDVEGLTRGTKGGQAGRA